MNVKKGMRNKKRKEKKKSKMKKERKQMVTKNNGRKLEFKT